jgi:hypothetical protein
MDDRRTMSCFAGPMFDALLNGESLSRGTRNASKTSNSILIDWIVYSYRQQRQVIKYLPSTVGSWRLHRALSGRIRLGRRMYRPLGRWNLPELLVASRHHRRQ